MKKIVSVSIGIPAYNEQENIKQILTSLCDQKQHGFFIKEIIVISDGSTDNTVKKVKEVHDKRIRLVDSKERHGKPFRLNQLFEMFSGEILFLVDADILIRDPFLLAKIIQTSDFKRAGIIGVNTIPLLPQTMVEKIFSISMLISHDIAISWNEGNNYLGFRGSFLGFDGEFAKSIVLPTDIVNDDAYLYILARQRGYLSHHARNATVFFRCPGTFTDHRTQSSRYQDARNELSKHFMIDISEEYNAPFSLVLQSTLRFLFLYPFEVLAYLGLRFITKLVRQKKLSSQWTIAKSTKVLLSQE